MLNVSFCLFIIIQDKWYRPSCFQRPFACNSDSDHWHKQIKFWGCLENRSFALLWRQWVLALLNFHRYRMSLFCVCFLFLFLLFFLNTFIWWTTSLHVQLTAAVQHQLTIEKGGCVYRAVLERRFLQHRGFLPALPHLPRWGQRRHLLLLQNYVSLWSVLGKPWDERLHTSWNKM